MKEELFRDDTILVDDKELYPVPNHPGYFADFEAGRIFNTFSEKWLGNGNRGSKRLGYVYISMKDKYGNNVTMSEHWAVFSAYMGIPKTVFTSKGITLHHIDGVKNDNSVLNLQPIRHRDQYKDDETKKRLKQRTHKRMTAAEKDTLESAWGDLENPKRSEFVNEWSEKLDIHWRTLDNYVKDNLLN